jgi:hypothetical protein
MWSANARNWLDFAGSGGNSGHPKGVQNAALRKTFPEFRAKARE